MRILGLAALGLVGCLLAGCSANTPLTLQSGGHFAVVDHPESVIGDARVFGALAVDKHGCWGLGVISTGRFVPVMWPSGTQLVGGRIRLPGVSKALGVGTRIIGGGGSGSATQAYPPCMAKGAAVTYIADTSVGK